MRRPRPDSIPNCNTFTAFYARRSGDRSNAFQEERNLANIKEHRKGHEAADAQEAQAEARYANDEKAVEATLADLGSAVDQGKDTEPFEKAHAAAVAKAAGSRATLGLVRSAVAAKRAAHNARLRRESVSDLEAAWPILAAEREKQEHLIVALEGKLSDAFGVRDRVIFDQREIADALNAAGAPAPPMNGIDIDKESDLAFMAKHRKLASQNAEFGASPFIRTSVSFWSLKPHTSPRTAPAEAALTASQEAEAALAARA